LARSNTANLGDGVAVAVSVKPDICKPATPYAMFNAITRHFVGSSMMPLRVAQELFYFS
jgi:cephalosporin-C deacetylase-like acetyl esterase